jgi:hypothetical protein
MISTKKLIYSIVVVAITTDVFLLISNKIDLEIASVIFLVCCLLLFHASDFDDKA